MAGKTKGATIPPNNTGNNNHINTNKDLSCLRCRKKKAKCSKTRPTCTRCARSNQPCEYPDAPPNLTDLSQKVLTLYDTLRQLEGEFLIKYVHNVDTDGEELDEFDADCFSDDSNTPTPFSSANKKQKQYHSEPERSQPPPSTEDPATWSMSLTPVGLSLQAVTRNCAEFNEFAKVLSRQLVHDFGVECLPKKWDPDAEGYFEESDQDELDEDEYLVTVPIFSISSLLDTQSPRNDIHRTPRIISNKDIYTLIRDHYPYILKYLYTYYQALETNTMITSHHIITLMLQLKSCLPINQPPASTSVPQLNAITELCIITAYVISIILLPPIPYSKPPPLPSHLLEYCTEYATSLLVDIVLSAEDSIPPYPILLCSILLGWIKVETPTECRTDYLVHMALRLLCAVYEQNDTIEWRVMVASLLYLDIYSAIIQSKRPQLRGEGSSQLWRSIMRKRQSSEGLYNTGILLEAQLMSLLDRILSLFYEVKDKPLSDKKINVRKIDVDEVLTLVRDIELWENDLPEWIKWNTQNMNEPAYLSMKLHIHMIHNIAKILLYRPFCTEFINPDNKNEIQADEQTYTKTTFLDMSMISADRLVTCVHNLVRFGFSGYWINTASIAVRDVSGRVRQLFDKDEEISNQLKTIEDRLQRAERI